MLFERPRELTVQYLPLSAITERLQIRALSQSGVQRLKASMQQFGFLEQFPLVLHQKEQGKFQLIVGNHRYEAAQLLGLPSVPCVIRTGLSEQACYTLAVQSNYATETLVPSTLVTYAEFIWARMEHYTQTVIAEMLGWSRDKVAKYVALREICPEAWDIIVTTFEQTVTPSDEPAVTADVTGVTFTENLLRDILPLSSAQQVELVQSFATRAMKKARVTDLAKAYRARNEMAHYASSLLGELGEPYAEMLAQALESGAYDTDWKTTDHPKLHKLLTTLRDEWERTQSIHLLQGDFAEAVKKLGDGCIDLILTDPPYNITCNNTFELEGRSPLSQYYGAWDQHPEQEFIALFENWAREWMRVLREQGSGYVFCADRYLSHLRTALEHAGLHVKATIVWHKTNPGTQVVKTNFKSSVEYILFFTKGQGDHTFNWQGENEMHNFLETPICGGKERLVDGKGNTLHPNQKPEQVIRHFLDISSNRGDTVFDGFAGVGTTGKVAKDGGRKFIGIEQDPTYFEAMQRRMTE